MSLIRQLIFCLAVGGLIVLACDRASGQSCGTYSRGYSRGTTYSYSAPTYSSYSTYSYSTPTMSYAAPPAYVAPAATYEAPVVKKELTYLRFLAVLPLVELPSYSAVYTPPPPAQQQQQNGVPRQAAQQAADPQAAAILDQLRGLNEGLTRLDRKVGQIDARLERLERTPRGPIQQQQAPTPPPPPAEPGPQPDKEPAKSQPQQQTKAATSAAAFIAANKASCAACHQGKEVADAHGGGFVFTELDGGLAKLDSKQVLSVQRQLTTGKMPKVDTARARAMGVVAPTQAQADAIFRRLDEYVLTMTE